MIEIKPLQGFALASDFVSPLTGTTFSKGSLVGINTSFQSERLGEFDYVKPNPVFLYLRIAENLLIERKNLLKSPEKINTPFLGPPEKKPKNEYLPEYILNLLQTTVGGIIILFSGLEAFVNQQIPPDIKYTRKRKPNEKYDHLEVQKRIGTREKLSRVLVLSLKKDIRKNKALWKNFSEFERLRHELVHLKMPHEKIYINTYDKLFNDLIDVDLEKYFKTVKEIINFYIPNFVEKKTSN